MTVKHCRQSCCCCVHNKMNVLVTGGSGYLGQFIIQAALTQHFQVTYTYSTRKLSSFGDRQRLPGLESVRDTLNACQVDLATGEGVSSLMRQGPFHAVINCAAISQPGMCEQNPGLARSVNVPSKLLDLLQQQKRDTGVEALLIHMSTDQVYDGSKSFWHENDNCQPVNAYGRSKLEAEIFIAAHWPQHVILRSSIIYGPLPPDPVPRALFLQFMETSLQNGVATSFFDDEFRSPIYVMDIVYIVLRLLSNPDKLPPRKVYNMGGPARLSRVDMANQVAEVRGYSKAGIISAPSSSVLRSVTSPPDISMSVKALVAELEVKLTSFSEALHLIPPSA